MKGIVSPCTEICRYEEIDGEPRCISCFRTYEDLSNWMYLTNEERQKRIKQIKKDRREYERKQKDNENMGKEILNKATVFFNHTMPINQHQEHYEKPMPLKTYNQKCNQCKADAKYYTDHKWWCGLTFQGHGYCKAEKDKK